MLKYIPFMKAKSNEFAALKLLEDHHKQLITPFFDLPFKKGMDDASYERIIKKASRKFALNLKEIPAVFIDDFDIPDTVLVNGSHGYEYLAECMLLEGVQFNPVVGLDRTDARVDLVFNSACIKEACTSRIALRITPDDLVSYRLVRDRILEFIELGQGIYDNWTLVIDNRFCSGIDAATRAGRIVAFCKAALEDYAYESVIIAGSSLPSSIASIVATNTESDVERSEVHIYNMVVEGLAGVNIYFGDYTVVSPDYSDADIDPQNMLNVTAPKVIYSYGRMHFIVRGGRIKGHPRGYLQYNDIAKIVVSKYFYRGPKFSAGDLFLMNKCVEGGKKVTPSNILCPVINAHIVFMLQVF
ncbi:beta family protein [Pseudomonas segetis]